MEYDIGNAAMAFETYFALKSYFKEGSKYDYFKYKGKILRKSIKDNFQTNHEFHNGLGLYYKYKSKDEIEKAVVSSLIKDSDIHITQISYDTYIEQRKRYESILYIFSQDLQTIFSDHKYSNPKDHFVCNDEYSNSHIYDLFINEKIYVETVVILNTITKFLDKIKETGIDFIFEEDIEKIKKYEEFFKRWVKFNKLQFKDIFKQELQKFYHEGGGQLNNTTQTEE